jgi:hypothetical protein
MAPTQWVCAAQRRKQASKNCRLASAVLADEQVEAGLKFESSMIELAKIGQG